ncbi:MAG: hypothetical protein IK126_12100 [Bacteroidales bacterium]|nr:hypothetical protein [Bacteroidales bacterium]
MNYKYNILWLDDLPIKELDDIKETNPNIYFDKVDYVDVCEAKLSSQTMKYHAVILDVNGIRSDAPEKDANKSGFFRLVHIVQDKLIPLYIYSAQILRAGEGDPVTEELEELGLKEQKNIFYKADAPFNMIDSIIKDLEEKYLFYVGHEYLLSFFSKGWIEQRYKTEFLDPIMEIYYQKDYDSAHGNHMRNMTEQMLLKVNKEWNLDTVTKENDQNRYKNIVYAIKGKKLDCSSLVIGPLMHMIEITNGRSHEALTEDDRKLYFESDFSTFFIVANWFNRLMSLNENAQDVDYTVPETDDKQTQTNQLNIKPQKHEDNRSGVVVSTYKEKGHTYCDLKVKIPWPYEQYDKVKITSIIPNTKSYFKGDWFPYCQEIKE